MQLFDQKRRFAFGCMRLPMKGNEVDIEQFKQMVDAFIQAGFTYFDTAHGYIEGKSELAIKEALSSRYPRDAYSLTNKLTEPYFSCEEDIEPFFMSQLKACGVEYFDYYLMHAQNRKNVQHFDRCKAYEKAVELKNRGLIKHIGISFHDSADVLDDILTRHPMVEVVQIQFNYLDYHSASIQSKACYDVCVKHNKPILVMEPVKGGSLVNLPEEARAIFDKLGGGSYASYAIRFVLNHPQVAMVLSGMSDMQQMLDNISYTADFKPLTPAEEKAIEEVRAVFESTKAIGCTKCRYCVEQNQCPMNIRIPEAFAAYNARVSFKEWSAGRFYRDEVVKAGFGRPEECIECGGCEAACPQHLPIRELLKDVAKEFADK